MSKKQLRFKRSGEFFKYNGKIYRIGHLISNTNGYVACVDIITHKTTRFHLDLEVEELQGSEDK